MMVSLATPKCCERVSRSRTLFEDVVVTLPDPEDCEPEAFDRSKHPSLSMSIMSPATTTSMMPVML